MFAYLVILLTVVLCLEAKAVNQLQEDTDYWNSMAQEKLREALALEPNRNIAKNVILFLGDGMGISTVTAGRILKGQLQGKPGEEEDLVFDTFPYSCLVKTYNVDQQTPDSAGTATAFLAGVKANAGTVGVGPSVGYKDCENQHTDEVKSILHWSQAKRKSVGVVTTTRVTHATPACSYAHSAARGWEGDSQMTSVTGGCKDIADQLVTNNNDIQVILGGGSRFWVPYDQLNPVDNKTDSTYGRRDGRNLIEEWKTDKINRNKRHAVVYNKQSLNAVDLDSTDNLLGLFSTTHLNYELERTAEEPSLEEMTEAAIKMLQKNDDGFFLLVEGGRIDHAHHSTRARRSLHETVMFDKAVAKGKEMTNQDDTLLVVTADHSHVFTIGGYASRGNPILGVTDGVSPTDGFPATTILYGNGPGSSYSSPREDITDKDIAYNTYRYQSAVPVSSESHGGEDVAVFAIGPMAHLFQGVKEQNYIAHVMAYASCVGQNQDNCGILWKKRNPKVDLEALREEAERDGID